MALRHSVYFAQVKLPIRTSKNSLWRYLYQLNNSVGFWWCQRRKSDLDLRQTWIIFQKAYPSLERQEGQGGLPTWEKFSRVFRTIIEWAPAIGQFESTTFPTNINITEVQAQEESEQRCWHESEFRKCESLGDCKRASSSPLCLPLDVGALTAQLIDSSELGSHLSPGPSSSLLHYLQQGASFLLVPLSTFCPTVLQCWQGMTCLSFLRTFHWIIFVKCQCQEQGQVDAWSHNS